MAYKTVAECLSVATDSVNLINDINTNGSSSTYIPSGLNQTEINQTVQRNVDHLETILAYTTPDVAGSTVDKSSYTTAITTGNTYITDNS